MSGWIIRAVLQQPVQDVDGLPDAAGDEAGEQGDVAVGDVVVGDAAIAAVADVPGPEQVVLAQLDVRAVGDRGAAAAPMPRQREAGILADHVDHRRFQLVGVDVLGVDPAQRLRGGDLGGVTGGLVGAEIAAVAEHGEQVALDGLGELRIGAGGRPEVAGVARPVLGMLEDVEQVAFRHAGADFLLEFRQPLGLVACRQLLQVGRSVRVDAQLAVGRKAGVDLGGERRQFVLQGRGEVLAALRDAERGAVGRQPRLAFRPGQQLGPVVGEIPPRRRHRDRRPARRRQDGRRRRPRARADQKRQVRPALDDKALPALRGEAEIDLVRQLIAARMAVLAHDRQSVQQAAVLRRRADVQQIEQPEQQAAVSGMDRPEQRQVVVAVPGGYRLALLGQRLDTALFRQELSDLAPERGVGFLRLRRLEHLAEDADQGFLDSRCSIVQGLQLLLGRGLGSPDAAQQHLDQFVAAAHAGLAQQGEQQRVPLARLRDVEEIAHLQGRGLGGELAELGVGDALQERIGVEQAGQPVEPLDPEPDRFRGRGAGRLLQAIEVGGRAVRRPDQQGVQHRGMFGREACRDPVVDPRMNFGAQPVDQPVEGAERRQIDRCRLQRLDRPVDEVGRVAHGLGGFESGAGDQRSAASPYGATERWVRTAAW